MGKWVHRVMVDAQTGVGQCAECGDIQAVHNGGKWRCPIGRRELGKRYEKQKYLRQKNRRRAFIPDNPACGLCGDHLTVDSAQVDHDHSVCSHSQKRNYPYCKRCVRGVLCRPCNIALGFFGEDPERLRAAAAYIENFRARAAA